jgi:hypothetical protein
VDWVAELDVLRRPHAVRSAEDARSQLRRWHEVTLPGNAPFENMASASFAFVRAMTVDDAVDWLATYSGLITASAEERAAALAHARQALLRRASADGMIEIPIRSTCWRADRAHRPA